MSIDQQDLNKLSQLAKIDINEQQAQQLTNSLSNILDMVADIQSADTQNIQPLLNPLDATQVLRKDKISAENQRDELQTISPNVEEGLFLVPKVIE